MVPSWSSWHEKTYSHWFLFFEGAHVIQGYGLLDEIPTLYGLMWNTPKFIKSLMARLTGTSLPEDSGKP